MWHWLFELSYLHELGGALVESWEWNVPNLDLFVSVVLQLERLCLVLQRELRPRRGRASEAFSSGSPSVPPQQRFLGTEHVPKQQGCFVAVAPRGSLREPSDRPVLHVMQRAPWGRACVPGNMLAAQA